jgi:hypothetical protein
MDIEITKSGQGSALRLWHFKTSSKSEATSKATDRSVRPTRATPAPTAAGFACMDSRGRLSPHESKADLGRACGTRLLSFTCLPDSELVGIFVRSLRDFWVVGFWAGGLWVRIS